MYHMARATLRDLRYNFPAVENLLAGGDEVQITRRKRVVARLLPPENRAAVKRPDFLARLRKIYGHKRLSVSGAKLLAAERSRY
jgi:antitoxin (DNA-binding transcriptional repressor) of toxin-antitoxin stability system